MSGHPVLRCQLMAAGPDRRARLEVLERYILGAALIALEPDGDLFLIAHLRQALSDARASAWRPDAEWG